MWEGQSFNRSTSHIILWTVPLLFYNYGECTKFSGEGVLAMTPSNSPCKVEISGSAKIAPDNKSIQVRNTAHVSFVSYCGDMLIICFQGTNAKGIR